MTGSALRRPLAVVMAVACVAASLTLALQRSTPVATRVVADGVGCERPGWVSAWSMPPSDAAGTPLAADVTLRQLIYPHLSGGRVRFRFSNAMSPSPVVIGETTVGLQGLGASVTPGSMVPLSFGGRRGVTIPPGHEVLSDPLSFSFSRFQELTVSSYLTVADPTPTEHYLADQDSYLASTGDHVKDASGAAFVVRPMSGQPAGRFSSQTFLTGLDVLPAASDGAVVAFGDSITDGLLPHDLTTNVRWPDVLARRLGARGVLLSVANAGISGNQLLAGGDYFGLAAPDRFDADALQQAGVRTVVLFEGINDLSYGRPAATLEAVDTGLIRRAHAAGLRILLATLTPAGSSGDGGVARPGTETRISLNVWIRSQRLADGVLDFDSVVADPANPTRLAPHYDGGDHLHLSPAGYTALADAVPLSLLLPAGCLTD